MRYVSRCAAFFRKGLQDRMGSPAEPATLIGLAMMVETVCLLAINIFSPPPFGTNPNTGLPELNPAMALLMQPLSTAAYFVILVGFGGWLQIRHRASSAQCGRAAAKITFLASIPTLLAVLLMLSHVLRVVVLGPGEGPMPFHAHGFALTYYSAEPHAPAGWLLLAAIVLRLPGSFVLGVIGGVLGRWTNYWAGTLTPHPADCLVFFGVGRGTSGTSRRFQP